MSVCLSVCLYDVCPSVCLLVCPSVGLYGCCLSVCQSAYLSVFMYVSVCLSVFMYVCQSDCLSLCMCQPVCRSVLMYVRLPVWTSVRLSVRLSVSRLIFSYWLRLSTNHIARRSTIVVENWMFLWYLPRMDMMIGPIEESFAMMNRYQLHYPSSDAERVDGLTYAWKKLTAQV